MKTYGTRTLLLITALAAIVCGLIIPAIQSARDAALEMACSNNLKQIGLGLMNFESAYRRFPLAIETSSDGKRWRSWRSHVYPTFMEQMPNFYDASSPWDSKANLRLIEGTPIATSTSKGGGTTYMTTLPRVPRLFACPKCKVAKGVNYVVVTGDGTAFPKSSTIKFSDITDGIENTVVVVESVSCTPDWTEPRDLDIETMDFKVNSRDKPAISSMHHRGALVCFADMQVYKLTTKATEFEVKALLTIAGGEAVSRDDLITRGVLVQAGH